MGNQQFVIDVLVKYARHWNSCQLSGNWKLYPEDPRCTCGLDDLLDDLKKSAASAP